MIPRQVQITPVLNGYLVHVGCQLLVFSDRATLMQELNDYLIDPAKVEAIYRAGSIHRELIKELRDEPVPTPPPQPISESSGPCEQQGSQSCNLTPLGGLPAAQQQLRR